MVSVFLDLLPVLWDFLGNHKVMGNSKGFQNIHKAIVERCRSLIASRNMVSSIYKSAVSCSFLSTQFAPYKYIPVSRTVIRLPTTVSPLSLPT